jgi:hypothetical protein
MPWSNEARRAAALARREKRSSIRVRRNTSVSPTRRDADTHTIFKVAGGLPLPDPLKFKFKAALQARTTKHLSDDELHRLRRQVEFTLKLSTDRRFNLSALEALKFLNSDPRKSLDSGS